MGKDTATSTVTTIGIDLGKRVFHVHGVDAQGAVVLRGSVKRGGC
jgi:transposase